MTTAMTSSIPRSVSFGQNQQVEFDHTMASNQIGQKLQTWLAPILSCGPGASTPTVEEERSSWEMHLCGEQEESREEPPSLMNDEPDDDDQSIELTVENVLEYEELKKNNMLPDSQLERDFYKSADALCKIQQQSGKKSIQEYEEQIEALKAYLEQPKTSEPKVNQEIIDQRMKATIAMVQSITEQQKQLEEEFVKQAAAKKSYFSIPPKDAAEDVKVPPPLLFKMKIAASKHEATATTGSYKTPEQYLNDDVVDASEEPVQCLERPKHARRPPAVTPSMRMYNAIFGEQSEPAIDASLKQAWGEIMELAADLNFSLANEDDETAANQDSQTPPIKERDVAPIEDDAAMEVSDDKNTPSSKTNVLRLAVKKAAQSLLRKPSTDQTDKAVADPTEGEAPVESSSAPSDEVPVEEKEISAEEKKSVPVAEASPPVVESTPPLSAPAKEEPSSAPSDEVPVEEKVEEKESVPMVEASPVVESTKSMDSKQSIASSIRSFVKKRNPLRKKSTKIQATTEPEKSNGASTDMAVAQEITASAE